MSPEPSDRVTTSRREFLATASVAAGVVGSTGCLATRLEARAPPDAWWAPVEDARRICPPLVPTGTNAIATVGRGLVSVAGHDGQRAWRVGRERFEKTYVGAVEAGNDFTVGDVGSAVRAAYDFDGTPLWVRDGDARYSPYAALDDDVVVGGTLGDAGGVRAIRSDDGSALWDATPAAWDDEEFARDAVVADRAAVAIGTESRVAAVDRSGTVRWSRGDDWDTHGPGEPSLATDGDTVVATSGAVAGFDAATGSRLWRHVLPDFATGVAVDEGLAVVTVAGEPPKVDSWDEPGGVLAYDLATGEERWRETFTAPVGHPAVNGEIVDVATDAGDLWRLDDVDGEPRWRRSVGDRVYTPVTHEYPYCIGVERDGTAGILALGR